MNKKNKGEFGYLNYKKKINLLITGAALLIILAIFIAGLIIFKSRNNYMTLVATVLVLPWAKLAVSFFVLLSHKACPQDIHDRLEKNCGSITTIYDVVVSNSKKPIGVCAMAVTDNSVIALSLDKAPDKQLFEKSLKEFLKNDKLSATVTLYTDVDSFIKRASTLTLNFDSQYETKTDRMKYIKDSTLNMCL